MFDSKAGSRRHSTNQNALFVEWFSRLERAVFRVVHGEIFPLFQAWISNFDTIPPWHYTLYLVNSYVTFKYFAFLIGAFETSLNCSVMSVQSATMIWVLFSPFFFDSFILVTVSGFSDYFGHLVTSTFLLCKFRSVPGSTPDSFPVMRRSKCLGLQKKSSQPSST